MSQSATTRRGRPRDGAVDQRVLSAAWELLHAGGYPTLNMDEVAVRAAVAKTTLYRRWPTKDHLAIAVAAQILGEVPIPDTGDLRHDLTQFASALAASLNRVRLAGNPAGARPAWSPNSSPPPPAIPTSARWSAPGSPSGTSWPGPACSAPSSGRGSAGTSILPC